ncbi:MAG: argininosuccinate lyase [Clostridia bacterium]|nr:argininosuccinate lyase [Clostridia bacterium]MDE7329276.1 argininosuccinate lyase [Clostridia bacterium]
MAKMWQGRFKKELDSKVNDFNSSISFDSRMYKHDIQGSIVHVNMLGKQGIIDEKDSKAIAKELAKIYDDIASGSLEIDSTAEDIHMFVEQVLTERLGDLGKKLHTARSRNDQVALDLRMYLREEIDTIVGMIKNLIAVLVKKAEENINTVMPGYTHLQRAQPITFAHHLMAYAEMFKRDMVRMFNCYDLMNECPLGSGALATTTYPIDREYTAEFLGFAKPMDNSLDGVSDRDYCIELANAIAICMMHLSRLSEEVVLWSSWEFKFIELDDAYSTGSSIMPQKKNPDICELIRGKTGRSIGNVTALLSMMKGLPLAYNKDMQEDKEAIFDSVDTVKLCLSTLAPMLDTMTVNKTNMANAGKKGFINATDCADYLVKKGLPFRDAYKISGTLVGICVDKGIGLDELPLDEYKKLSDKFDKDVYDAISLERCVSERKVLGGPAPQAVKEHIRKIKETVLKEEDE